MQEKENVLLILREAIKSIEQNNGYKLKKLSERTNHIATVYQDPDNIILAVLAYALGKIMERENYRKLDGWNRFINKILKDLKLSAKYLEKDRLEEFRDTLGDLRGEINNFEGNLRDYINDVFYKAGVNRAFRYYEHGLSSQKTAELLGVSLWDLNSFIGQNSLVEINNLEVISPQERIKLIEQILK